MEELWQRVSRGQHTVLLGVAAGEPPGALDLRVLRIHCDVPEAALGPLLEARRIIDRLVGGAPPLLDQARSRVVSGLRKGRLERAAQRLGSAIQIQQSIADLVGLARSTEVLSADGKHREALMLLSDSVALNLEKGSPIGLAFNRRTLAALAPSLDRSGDAADAVRQVSMQLASAESVLGRLTLPGERD